MNHNSQSSNRRTFTIAALAALVGISALTVASAVDHQSGAKTTHEAKRKKARLKPQKKVVHRKPAAKRAPKVTWSAEETMTCEYVVDDENPTFDPCADGDVGMEASDDTDDDSYVESNVFPVSGDTIDVSGADPRVARTAVVTWNRFAKLIPSHRRQMIRTFALLPSDDEYDGQVQRNDARPSEWALRLKPGDGYNLDFLNVHEFGHLLTLSQEQLDDRVSEARCTTYRFWEGCPKPNSFTERFVKQFWTPDMARQADTDDNRVYKQHPRWFVRDYSATNPGEDLADTFAEFVLEPKPTKARVVDQKLNLFWSDPAMVQLRAELRANLM
jgi:hypothetical protein